MEKDGRLETVLAGFGIVALCLVPVGLLLAAFHLHRRPEKRPVGRGFGVLDELYRPSAHRAAEIRKDEQVRPAPAPLPARSLSPSKGPPPEPVEGPGP